MPNFLGVLPLKSIVEAILSKNLRSSQSSVNPLNRNSGTFFLTESSIFAIVPTIFLVFLVLLSFFDL